MAALQEAIDLCGGVAAFAAAINTDELRVTPGKVSMWKSRGSVPAEYAPAIYRETAKRGEPVACERIAPRVDWDVLRMQAGISA